MVPLKIRNGGWNLEWWFVMSGIQEVRRFKTEAAAKRYVAKCEGK